MADAKKFVVKVEVHCEKDKKKALKAVSGFQGIDSLTIEIKDRKLTVVGTVDPVKLVEKLRRCWHAEILSVGPAKEPEKKKKEEGDKDKGKDADKQNAEMAKACHCNDCINPHFVFESNINPRVSQYYCAPISAEENPNSFCGIM
ncbi:hypothetical protein Cni_G15357 [Canna indica]|uniref:HMA domain-containing protein n=1 Tax=Canna indica TaxID=4628 RepID=A0AAQ3KGV3_9LILI|nr:hypothetical protein Cni_G15357 [Canna indica]